MRLTLNNAQGVPYLEIADDREVARVYFCKDGGLIVVNGKAIGTRLGCRPKASQAGEPIVEAEVSDGIRLI